jgi:hypothetical protein
MAFKCHNNRPLRLAGDCQGGVHAYHCQGEARDAGSFKGLPSIPGEQCWRVPVLCQKGLSSNASSRFLFMSASVLEELCALLDDSADLLELIGSGEGNLLAHLVGSRLASHCLQAAEKLRDSLEQVEAIAFGGITGWAPVADC